MVGSSDTSIDSLLQSAQQHGQAGRLDQVINCCSQVLNQHANNLPALQMVVMANFQLGHLNEAQKHLDNALELMPNHPLFHNLSGVISCKRGDYAKGIDHYRKAVEIDPNYSEATYNLALAYQESGDLERALEYLNKAAISSPNIPNIHNSIGIILQKTGDYNKAIEAFQKAVSIDPKYVVAYVNIGLTQRILGEEGDAIKYFKRAIDINPQFAESYEQLGISLQRQEKYSDAIANFEKALKCNQRLKSAHLSLASLLSAGDRHPQALEVLQKALVIFPDDADLLTNLVATKKASCDWDGLEELSEKLIQITMRQIENNEHVSLSPFSALAMWTTTEQQYEIAKNHAKFYFKQFPQHTKFIYRQATKKRKIKLAYISPNFRNHPTTQNVLGLLQRHNREKFEIYVYALNNDDGSVERKNIVSAADHFCDLTNMSYIDAAEKINKDGIDIMVSLMGYIDRSRVEILADHPCPIQIGYQSFAGTLGTNVYDYFIADKTVIPEHSIKFYSEKIINMPYSYYAIDINRPQNIAVSREECGLPDNKFVYACFCSHYKVEPKVFEMWMQILKSVPDSVLWLFGKLEHVKNNLKHAATHYGIDSQRLIFAHGCNKKSHLARHVCADLFLDTLIYGAHTTAVDALKMGIPLITLPGDTLVTRVSAALLQSIEAPELIVNSEKEYVDRAIYFATHEEELKKVHNKVTNNFSETPLFNLDNYVRYFEYGLSSAWSIYEHGEKPRQIDIPKRV